MAIVEAPKTEMRGHTKPGWRCTGKAAAGKYRGKRQRLNGSMAAGTKPGRNWSKNLDQTSLDKSKLIEHLDVLKAVFHDYDSLMDRLWGSEGLTDSNRRLLLEHKGLSQAEDSPLNQMSAIGGVLANVVERIRTNSVTYHVPVQSSLTNVENNPELQGLSEEYGKLNIALEGFTGHLGRLSKLAPLSLSPRVDMLLVGLNSLFKSIVRRDWEDVELVLTHINMISTSGHSHELMDRVGRMVREIYNSLNEISNDYDIKHLSASTQEIPDAVEKLQSVIDQLEQTANHNLDLIETLTNKVSDNRKLIERAVETLGGITLKLSTLEEAHPEAADALRQVGDNLDQRIRTPFYEQLDALEDTHANYMKLFAAQSFQDLTGQTLKKVIAFIESLQYQLIRIITRDDSAKPTADAVADPDAAPQEGPDAVNRLSQEKVDNLLAEMGF